MGTVVNKPAPTGDPNYPDFATSLSANTPDFSLTQWVVNSANLAGLIGSGTPSNPQVPKRYWVMDPVSSQNLREMTAPEKAVVDASASALSTARGKRKGELADQAESFLTSRYKPIEREAFVELLARGPDAGDRAAVLAYIDWLTTFYVALGAALAAVDAAATVLLVEAVTLNTAPFVTSDPLTTLAGVVPNKGRRTLGFVVAPMLANTTVSNSTADIDGPVATAPANTLKAEQVYRLTWYFSCLHTAALTPTVIAELVIGGSPVATLTLTPLLTLGATFAGRGEATFTVRSDGAAGSVVGAIIAQLLGTTQGAMWGGGLVGNSPVALDTTVSNLVQIRMRMGTAVAANALTISQGWLDRLN